MGTFAANIVRLGYFAWELSFDILHLELSLGNVRLGSVAWADVWQLSLGDSRLGYVAWVFSRENFSSELSFGSFRLGTLPSLRKFRLAFFAWDLLLGWDISLGNFRL